MEPATMIAAGTALASLLGSLFGKKESETKQYPTLGPSQIGAQDAVLQQVLAGLSGGPQGPYSFAPIRQAAESQFHQRTIPSIAQRFSGADAQRGSGFQQALGLAGAGLSENLASQEAGFNQQYLGNLMHMLQLGLQPRFTTVRTPEGQNQFGQAMSGLTPILGQLGGAYQQQQNFDQLSKLFGGTQQTQPSSDYNNLSNWLKNLNVGSMGMGAPVGSPTMSGGRAF